VWLINRNTESQLVNQLRLNAAVDLYERRLKALSRTDAGDQAQFQGRIADIQKAFTFFKGKGSVQGVQVAATELGRILEYSREVNRIETGRLKSQEKLQGFAAEISKYKALGLNTAKAENAFESFAVNAGTNKYALAQKFNDILIRRLRLLKEESRENERIVKQQFGASSPIQGAVDLIGSPINKAMGTKAAVALAQQKQQAAADELKALQGGTKAAVALAQQKQQAAADELKALQGGTKAAVALAQQKEKAAAQELQKLQEGTKAAVALARQKEKAAAQELQKLQEGTKAAVALARQKEKAAADELKALQAGTKAAVALAQQKQKALETQDKERTAASAKRLESIALGVGFPLLFGGSPGEVLGSLAGSFVGSGFGGQILGGAIGGIFDDFATKASKIGIALNPVTKDIDGLVTALGGSATAAGRYITKLEKLGRTQESLSAASDELARIVGAEGVDALKLFGNDAAKLGVLFAQVMLQMQANVATLINSSGVLRTILKAVEYNLLLKQALASKDPGLQKLQKEREKAGRPGFLGGSPDQVYALNDKLVEQQSRLNAAKLKQYAIDTLNLVKQENYFDILKETANLAGEVAKAREDASDKVRSAQIQELEQQKQIAMTAQAELSAINNIYAQKKQGIDAAYAATKREADLKVQLAAIDLASAKREQARGKATAEEAAKAAEAVSRAQKVYDAAVATTQETLRGAAATQSAATSAADLERRQQTVTAYTRQFADEAARASNKLNEAANAAANAASVTQALAQAEITINNVRIQSLQNSLNETNNAATRAIIIDKIRHLELRNALTTLYATRAQINAELTRQYMAARQVELKYEELKATVSIARAQGLMNRDYAIALENQEAALRIAYQNVKAGEQIADANWRAANATYSGAVDAANLKAQTSLAASAAGRFAGSMGRAADSMERAAGVNLQGFSGLEPWMEAKIAQAKQNAYSSQRFSSSFESYYAGVNAEIQMRTQFEKILNAQKAASNTRAEQDFWAQASTLGFGKFATGGYVTGPTLGLIGEGGEPEYIIPQSKMATAASNYLSGGRGAGIMEGGGGDGAVINIQTGPVMEMNGERYVTMGDFERGLRQVAGSVYKGLRTPAGRYATGVR
jgi:hypothetical protein